MPSKLKQPVYSDTADAGLTRGALMISSVSAAVEAVKKELSDILNTKCGLYS